MSTAKLVYQIKVTLIGLKPPIWRRFLVADTTSLHRLHDILQIVMGWTNSHMHHFIIDGEFYGKPLDDDFGDMRAKDETRSKLNQFVSGKEFRFGYEYDFGDSWEHELIVEKILPADKGSDHPVCTAGKRACPPEDVGGMWGYEDFLKAIVNPNHPEHEDLLEWIGGSFDPEYFNLEEVNIRLRHSRRSREAEQANYEPPQLDNHILKRITAWSQGLSKKQIALAEALAVRRDMVTLLNYFKEKRPVGTQSTGNLQLKAVREVCARFVSPPILDEKIGDKVYKLRSEEDVFWLFYLHVLANTGGLVIGGQSRVWRLASAGAAFLDYSAPIQLGIMLSIWWHQEDWRIAFPVSGLERGLPPDFREITLARLLKLKIGKLFSFEQFADELIVLTRLTWPSVDQTFVQSILRSVI
ncbi:MAG: plasmid pRiA4b ORF-3 family protein, partial [Anaerolineales bacterium]